MSSSLCPCGSQKTYATCCELVHSNHAAADHPEKLMRSRYSAHVLGLVDYVVATYHPSCGAEAFREGIADSINSEWLGLEVLSSSVDSTTSTSSENKQGYVEFKAHYVENGEQHCLHEKSRFITEQVNGDTLWYYIDGVYPEPVKVGRNDPCPCGSGKKHKKCCG